MTLFISAVFAGVVIGSIYAIVGIGYTVIYKATSIFNLAQGDFVMVAIMSSYFLLDVLHWPQLAAAVAVIAFVPILGLFEERTVVRVFLKKTGTASFGWFVATLGFSLVVETVVTVAFGRHEIVSIPSPFSLGGFHLGDVVFGYRQLFVIITFVIVIGLLELFYQRTWMGQAMRASAGDREAASLLGINPVMISRTSFAMAGVVAGIAGFAIAPMTFSNPALGLSFSLKGFLALAVGGFGSIRGAIVGGILLGIGEQLVDLYFGSEYEIATGIVLVVGILLIRPEGLFRSASARRV